MPSAVAAKAKVARVKVLFSQLTAHSSQEEDTTNIPFVCALYGQGLNGKDHRRKTGTLIRWGVQSDFL